MVLRPIFQMTVGLKDRERRNAPLDCECDGNYRCEQNPSRATITRKNRAAIHHKGRGRHYQKEHKRLVSRNPDRQRPGGSAREPATRSPILAACRVCELHSAQIAIATSRISND